MSARRQALEEAAQICDGHLKMWGDEPRCSPKVLGQVAGEIRRLKGVDYTAILSPAKKD